MKNKNWDLFYFIHFILFQLNEAISTMSGFALQRVCPYEKQACDAESEGYNSDERK